MRPRLREEGVDRLNVNGRLGCLHMTVLITYSIGVIFTPN